MTDQLGTFVDRCTFRWERTYPHPAERLWRAVSQADELSQWLSPDTEMDLRPGGACRFIWGPMTITTLDEPKRIELAGPAGETMRFEVDDLDGATARITVVQSLPPDFGADAVREGPGSDLPAFPHAPWQPRMLSGIHTCLTQLGSVLDGSGETFEHGHGLWREVLPAYRQLISTQIPGGNLARFVSRYALVYDRYYAHPIDRVWAALTVPEQMDQWMLPTNTVDALERGARFGMTFGAGKPPLEGTLRDVDPPHLVDYAFDNGSSMRFELREEDGGTWLAFTHTFPDGERGVPVAGDPGGDLPGGPDTPWRPGFVAGFHLQVDHLAPFLDTGAVDTCAVCVLGDHSDIGRSHVWEHMCEVYRQHIIDTIPGGVSS